MRLVDDLMEPFRPVVDLRVWRLQQGTETTLVSPDTKRTLVRTLYDDMQTSSGTTPVTVCLQHLAVSLAQVYLGERDNLDLPFPGLPLSLAADLAEDMADD
jgi:CRISPR-associated protein Cas1